MIHAALAGHGLDQIGRQPGGAVVAAAQFAHQRPIDFSQTGAGFGGGDQVAHLAGGAARVHLALQQRELVGSFVDPGGRHAGLLIPLQQAGHVLQQVNLAVEQLEAGERVVLVSAVTHRTAS